MKSLFDSVNLAPRDPILGLNEQFNSDSRPNKINLGIGVYYDEAGHMPLLGVVEDVEQKLANKPAARGYLPIDGINAYNLGAQQLLLGRDSTAIQEQRAVTVQTLGGTGALKVGADFLHTIMPNATVAISDPSWENHRALFEKAGFNVVDYPYYQAETRGFDIEAMLESISTLPEQSIIVLHACCHNPTGIDPSPAEWQRIADAIVAKNHVPFLDIAYQGFGDGLEQDAAAVRLLVERGIPVLISSSFSKSFALYGERVGALTVVTSSSEQSPRVLSQLKRLARTNYSNPPTHGAKVITQVFTNPDLLKRWENELTLMRERIKTMRHQLVQKLKEHGVKQDMSFILNQKGMFSYSGLSTEQVHQLRDQDGLYILDTGRICVAALNDRNIDIVAAAIARVLN